MYSPSIMLKNKTVNFLFLTAILIVIGWDVFRYVSVWYYSLILLAYIVLQAYGSIVLSAQYFTPVRFFQPNAIPSIALTFDDGPIPGKTDRILDILKRYEIHAAFFCIGDRASKSPGLI